jgi:hypothetical protein
MPAKPVNERDLVLICIAELCKAAGFADTSHLIQRDLEFISDSIESKTGVLISLSTIRRLINGQFARLPQIATLNAMANFAGYDNWQEFRIAKNGSINTVPDTTIADSTTESSSIAVAPVTSHSITAPPLPAKRTRSGISYAKYLVAGGILLLVAGGLLAMLTTNKPSGIANAEKASFSVFKATKNDLPNTVIFNFNIDDVKADSFFIQQSWDRNRRRRIFKGNHTLTDIYYEPGYHLAKLIANDQVIQTQEVNIPTDRWFFYSKDSLSASFPKYIHSTGFQNGSMLLNKEDIVNSKVNVEKENLYIQCYFPTEVKYSSDNYRIKFRVRVNDLNNNPCPMLLFEVMVQRHFAFFSSTPKGCSSEIMAEFGEKFVSGKEKDLSALGIDIRNWQNVEVTVENKNATIRFNDKVVYTSAYTESNGLITGLGFISNELCEVDYVKMETLDGKVIYANSFDE